jgi:hypothetical protein
MRYYKDHGQVPGCGFVPDSWFPAAFAEKGFLDFQFTREFAKSDKNEEGQMVLLELSGGEALNIVARRQRRYLKKTGTGLS